uniref:Uncharacterized protein n=1 Tax=Lygus hesperus TaxID=30085 RepID=A0A0A9VX95_LYGHE
MGRTSSNRTSSSLLNLALAAFYLNFTVKNADGSQFYQVGPVMPVALPPFDPAPVPWPEALGRYSQAGSQGFQGYGDNYKGTGGYRDGNGYYDDLMSTRNAYDIGKAYGGGQDYSKGAVAGGGYRDLSGRNKGHQAAGFSNSYRKDESGDKSTYYDDGLGHNARINYAAQDARFRDQGGNARRGGYHDNNLNRNAIGNNGRYGDTYNYKGYNGASRGYSGGNGYGLDKGYAGYSYPISKGFSGYIPTKGFSGYPLDKGFSGGYPLEKGFSGGFSGYPMDKGFSGGYTKGFPSHDTGYHRHGRVLPSPSPNDQLSPPPLLGPPGTTIKDTGIYVIPMPDKLYFDPIPEI